MDDNCIYNNHFFPATRNLGGNLIIYSATITAMTLVFVLFVVYRYEGRHIDIRSISEFKEGTAEIAYNIEEVKKIKNGDVIIKGWFACRGVSYATYNYGDDTYRNDVYNYMNLCLVDGASIYVLPTKLELRQDVSNYLNDGLDYRYCGFRARICDANTMLTKSTKLGMIVKTPDGSKCIYLLDSLD